MFCFCILLLLLFFYFFWAHQHKAAGRKTRLDIQNYGCNGNLLCYRGVVGNSVLYAVCSFTKAQLQQEPAQENEERYLEPKTRFFNQNWYTKANSSNSNPAQQNWYTASELLGGQFFDQDSRLITSLARMLCIRGTSHGPVSVCVCLCLSQAGVLRKRLNVGSHKQHHTIVQGL